jgi:hypothetical protein
MGENLRKQQISCHLCFSHVCSFRAVLPHPDPSRCRISLSLPPSCLFTHHSQTERQGRWRNFRRHSGLPSTEFGLRPWTVRNARGEGKSAFAALTALRPFSATNSFSSHFCLCSTTFDRVWHFGTLVKNCFRDVLDCRPKRVVDRQLLSAFRYKPQKLPGCLVTMLPCLTVAPIAIYEKWGVRRKAIAVWMWREFDHALPASDSPGVTITSFPPVMVMRRVALTVAQRQREMVARK